MEKFITAAFIILEKIGNTTSRTEKDALLLEGKDNAVFKQMLRSCYNPFLKFHVKKVPAFSSKTAKGNIKDNYLDFMVLLDRLSKRDITGNEALGEVGAVFSSLNADEYLWYSKVLKKDLKIGITDKSINKVYKEGKNAFIPTFSCMLAEKLNKYPKEFYVNPKMDGYRYLAYNASEVEAVSRNGHPIVGYDDVEEAISQLPKGFVYDGEIMDRDGAFNGTQKTAFKKSGGKDGVLHIFDMISIEEFGTGASTTPYKERLAQLQALAPMIEASSHLHLVEAIHFTDNSLDSQNRVQQLHDEWVKQGYEGAMVKDASAPYQFKKGRAIQKLKLFFDIDLVVVDVLPGEEGTQFENTLGALVVELSDKDIIEQLGADKPHVPGKTFTVKVGSGFKVLPEHEYNRDVLWANRTDLINRTIEIKCFGSSVNDDGGHSLRFPIFKRIRNDK